MIRTVERWAHFLLAGTLFGVALNAAFSAGPAYGALLIPLSGERSINLGVAARVELAIEELAASNSSDDSFDFLVTDARFFIDAQLNAKTKIKVAYAYHGEEALSEAKLLDAVLQYSFSEQLNVWLGRSIMPMDRASLADGYFRGGWDAPVASGVLGTLDGRDDGAVIWGEVDNGGFKYYLGAYEGFETFEGTEDNPLVVGRVVLNFWDGEPGYSLKSRYLGEKDVFALGVSWLFQKEAFYNGDVEGDYWGLTVDFLVEKNLANHGVFMLESALYDYDADNLSTLNGSSFDNRLEGDGYFVAVGYFFARRKGALAEGVEPLFRYHRFRMGQSLIDETIVVKDYGVTYFLAGHNSKFVFVYSDHEIDTEGEALEFSEMKFGAQLMF